MVRACRGPFPAIYFINVLNRKRKKETSIFIPRICTHGMVQIKASALIRAHEHTHERWIENLSNTGERRKRGIDRSLRRFSHCELFHFTLSPFAEWKPSTSHPSNPVSMHLLLTSYITITQHATPPFARLFASRPHTFPHSSKSTCTDYIPAVNVHRLVVTFKYATCDSANKFIDAVYDRKCLSRTEQSSSKLDE